MTTVLTISIGPVQSFISASRKTRDLKNGSDLLVFVVRKVAKSLLDSGCEMVFPSATHENVARTDAANVLVAVCPSNPRDAVEAAKSSAIAAMREKWNAATKAINSRGIRIGDVVEDVAFCDEQIESFLDFFAGWAHAETYDEARRLANRNLAASKALRSFGQPPSTGKPKPKSPLDQSLESAVRADSRTGKVDSKVCQHLMLKPREALDAVSLMKRFMHDIQVPSTRKVAVNYLLVELADEESIKDLAAFVKSSGSDFDEGDVLFDEKDDIGEGYLEDARRHRNAVRETLRRRSEGGSKKYRLRRYFAVVHADGDNMGKAIERIKDKDKHQELSERLAGFASQVERVVEEHCGYKVYAGGDDVLALLPIDTAIDCARKLNQTFADRFSEIVVDPKPTLTTAIAICPTEDNLQRSVQYAASLEKRAKAQVPNKNAIAVGVRIRGGTDEEFFSSWNDTRHEVLSKFATAFDEGRMPRGFGFEIEALAHEMKGLSMDRDHLQKEFERICQRKEPKVERNLYEGISFDASGIADFAKLLKIAHFMTRTGDESE
jgi:CRISPR-associated protein Cmr2